MSTRQALIDIQRAITERVKLDVRHYLEPISPQLRKYYHEYKREFSSYQRLSNRKELLSHIRQADIIYIGDYHTFALAQMAIVHLLRDIMKKKKRIVLAVEMVRCEFQDALDRYWKGESDEGTFLKEIDYEKTWGFDWLNYKPIFELCRYHKIPLIALNSSKDDDMGKRDETAAQIIAETLLEYPKHLVLVQYGDLHLASCHIPVRVEKILQQKGGGKELLIIYQNSETIYWKLAEKGLEQDIDTVFLGDGRFVIINSPPWLKLQSYVHWEEKSDELKYRFTDGEEEEIFPHHVDFADQIFGFVQTIAEFLGVEEDGLDHFAVYTMGDFSFINKVKSLYRFSGKDIEYIQSLFLANISFVVPGVHILYLSDLTVNNAASIASEFLYSRCARIDHLPADLQSSFYTMAIWEMIGFFGSKLINHKRSPLPVQEFKDRIKALKRRRLDPFLKIKRTVARGVLDVKWREEQFLQGKKFKPMLRRDFVLDPEVRFYVASAIGHMLGEKLYQAMIQEKVTRDFVKGLFYNPLSEKGEALSLYLYLLKEVNSLG